MKKLLTLALIGAVASANAVVINYGASLDPVAKELKSNTMWAAAAGGQDHIPNRGVGTVRRLSAPEDQRKQRVRRIDP